MRRLGIFLDSSSCMSSSSGDFKPNPLLHSIRLLESFVPEFLRRNTLGSAVVYELRDGICQQIAPTAGKWSSNASQLVGDLQTRYQAHSTGSGSASIVNALRVMMCDLGSDASSSSASSESGGGLLGFSGSNVSSALLITGSITLIDVGDVEAAIGDVAKLGIAVDVLSFCGAPHILELLCTRTGGHIMCPVTPASSLHLLLGVAHPSWRMMNATATASSSSSSSTAQLKGKATAANTTTMTAAAGSSLKRERHDDEHSFNNVQTMTPVALYHQQQEEPDQRQRQRQARIAAQQQQGQCPLCRAPQAFHGFPRSCLTCGLLSLSEVQWRTSRAESNACRIVAVPAGVAVTTTAPSSTAASSSNTSGGSSSSSSSSSNPLFLKCRGMGMCLSNVNNLSCVVHVPLDASSANNDEDEDEDEEQSINKKKTAQYVLRCLSCEAPFCQSCAVLFAETVRMCPSCGSMLEG